MHSTVYHLCDHLSKNWRPPQQQISDQKVDAEAVRGLLSWFVMVVHWSLGFTNSVTLNILATMLVMVFFPEKSKEKSQLTKKNLEVIQEIIEHFPLCFEQCTNGVMYYKASLTLDHADNILVSFHVKFEKMSMIIVYHQIIVVVLS